MDISFSLYAALILLRLVYTAPEAFSSNVSESAEYNSSIDVYSFGTNALFLQRVPSLSLTVVYRNAVLRTSDWNCALFKSIED